MKRIFVVLVCVFIGSSLLACEKADEKEAMTIEKVTEVETTVHTAYDKLNDDEKRFIDEHGKIFAKGTLLGKLEKFEIWGIADYENGWHVWYHMVDGHYGRDEVQIDGDGSIRFAYVTSTEEYEKSQYDVNKIMEALYELRDSIDE